MNKRERALEVIRTEYAKYGQETRESMRAYCENNISGAARMQAVQSGMKTFNAELKTCEHHEDEWLSEDMSTNK